MESSCLDVLQTPTCSASMLVNGTEIRNMVKGNVHIQMDQNIKVILGMRNSTVTDNSNGLLPKMKGLYMFMRAIGKKVRWMAEVNSDTGKVSL